jgi:HD-GYP domain-containing protein (c-di-GMP phosphodiesterase class II)
MKYRPRIYYSDEQKAIMWDRWKKGDSLHDIARLFDRNHSSVGRILSVTGGIRPPQRIRSHLALSLSEREEISRGVASQESFRSIAHRLGRSPSTISREINQKLIESYEQTIRGWIRVMDLRHQETKDHTVRVSKMTVELSKYLGITDKQELKRIETSATLHDVGKIGIPDAILTKPGPLTQEEFNVIKTHPKIAFDILSDIEYLKNCIDIPYGHHEKWAGGGYPRGISGDAIPLAARVFAVIDVWDALSHARVYKEAWPESKVLEYIQEQSGKQFDPHVVNVFIQHYESITKCLAR